jgi:hypothetical protein
MSCSLLIPDLGGLLENDGSWLRDRLERGIQGTLSGTGGSHKSLPELSVLKRVSLEVKVVLDFFS